MVKVLSYIKYFAGGDGSKSTKYSTTSTITKPRLLSFKFITIKLKLNKYK